MTNRQEVAKRLRELFPFYRYKDIYQAVLWRPPIDMMISERKQLFNRLADLIDPVCHLVKSNDDDGIKYTCSNCGHFSVIELQLLDGFKYCPVCGARIERDERVGND